MDEQFTEITFRNKDGESMQIRKVKDDPDIAEIDVEDNTFWFPVDQWQKVAKALEKICGS